MKSIEERLVASDPSIATPYAPADYEAMVRRVVAALYPKAATTWRGFKIKMASSVAAASLLTALGITALSTAGSTLPILGFAAASTPKTSGIATSPTAASTLMRLNVNYQFTGADNFSTAPGNGVAYAFSAPSDGGATLSQVAQVLHVDVGTPTTTDNGQSFTSSGPQYAGWLVQNAGYSSWGIDYSLNSLNPSKSLTADQLKARAVALAHRLGDLTLGVATIDTVSSDSLSPTSVTVPIVVGGLPTDLSYSFTFASDGVLMSASGQSFALASVGNYPLISPAAGVREITSQLGLVSGVMNDGGVAGSQPGQVGSGSSSSGSSTGAAGATTPPTPVVSPMLGSETTTSVAPTTTDSSVAPPVNTGPVTAVPSSPGTTDTLPTDSVPTTATTVPAPTIVNLTDVSIQYGVFTMANGTTMLLPMYVYVGIVVGESSYRATFRVVPIDPSYLDLSTVQNYNY